MCLLHGIRVTYQIRRAPTRRSSTHASKRRVAGDIAPSYPPVAHADSASCAEPRIAERGLNEMKGRRERR
jgi:hypothetical protein